MSNYNHYFHLVNNSPWPLIGSLGSLIFLSSIVSLFKFNYYVMLMLINGTLIILLVMFQWWRDICREGFNQGFHTKFVMKGLTLGMILFIISEVFFFISFFWSFFHSSLSNPIELGLIWPSKMIENFNPFKIPLLNTIILLTSGLSITWTHHSLINKNYKQTFNSLLMTILLGVYFSMIQLFEYLEAPFSIAESVYGSTFYMATGFHGIHVLIGTIFLCICLFRIKNLNFSNYHHFGFEAAAWYWHFVDVVWLFLYLSIYWWGS